MYALMIRIINICCIIGMILFYNMLILSREQADEIAKLHARLQTAEQLAVNQEQGTFKDGTYEGEAQGFGGNICIQAEVENGKISAISILSAEHEDQAYLDMAKAIIPVMVEQQTSDVDTISGATFSSEGIKNAVKQALEKAE